MGLLDPAPPPFEVAEWRRLPHLERIKPLAQDWALNGFGTPTAVYFVYVFKILAYAGLGALLIFASSGWPAWSEPIVFEKAAIWTMLWEVLGLGAGSLPLTLRFSPMVGGFLYWLRPGTTRLPPGRRGFRGRGGLRGVGSTSLYTRACWRRRSTCWYRRASTRPRPGSGARRRGWTRSRSPSCSPSSPPLACGTRSRS